MNVSMLSKGAVQLLRNALGGRGEATVWHFVTGGGGSAERYVTPKIIYMNNIYIIIFIVMYVYLYIFIHVLL